MQSNMLTIYHLVAKIWRALPEFVTKQIRTGRVTGAGFKRVRAFLFRHTPHDVIYDEAYYAMIDGQDGRVDKSLDVIADSIITHFQPASVFDVGCGTGKLLERLQRLGVKVYGLENSAAALKVLAARQLDAIHFDLESDDPLPVFNQFEVVVSLEIAEHLTADHADRYVEMLCNAAGVIVFTAATPGQGGRDHVNEQPNAYWIEKFARRRFQFDEELSNAWRRTWTEREVVEWYRTNLMIFRRI
jgi:2-polyprenyl-3-methyl-5-hydroxy-6-metoxy-1,4-benzoquinol methylase